MRRIDLAGRFTSRRVFAALGWVSVVVAFFYLPTTDPAAATINLAVLVGINAIIAYGVALLFGGGGLLSIAHGGLWGIGAYATALLTVHHNWSWTIALPAAMVLAGIIAALMGYPSLRVKGHYFVILSFALAELVRVVAGNWRSLTGGDSGVSILGAGERGRLVALDTRTDWYYAVGAGVGIVVLGIYLILRSRFGRRLVAIRENESLAEAVSIDTTRVKVTAFVLSGMLAGAAGVLWADYIRYVHPTQFGAEPGLVIVLMVLAGGSRSLAGPLVGAIFVVVVPDKLGLSPTQNVITLGVLLIAVILIFPRGIVPVLLDWLEAAVRRIRPRPAAATVEAVRWMAARVDAAPAPVTPADGEPLLVVRGVAKRFGGVNALRGVDVEVRPHEVLAIVGPNGSGKSTLFGIISGFVKPDGGTVVWEGKDIGRDRPHVRSAKGLVRTFQERMVFPDLTVAQNIEIGLVGAGRDSSVVEVEVLADYVRLTHRLHVLAGGLSWGETRLLGLALALAQRPRLLLLDEPFAGLSPIAAQDVTEIIERLIADGYALAIIDHEMAYLLPLCQRIIVLDQGTKVFEGDPAAFLEDEAVASAYLGAVDASV